MPQLMNGRHRTYQDPAVHAHGVSLHELRRWSIQILTQNTPYGTILVFIGNPASSVTLCKKGSQKSCKKSDTNIICLTESDTV